MTLYQVTGLVLIALPIAFNIVFFMLGRAFEYPDILRKPTDEILTRFLAGGKRLITLWYLFAMTSLLAIPLALLWQGVFAAEYPQIAVASAIVGALSGVVQAMGLLRWPLLVPMLAAQYQANPAQRETIGTVFNAFHQYMGVVVGEHLGYIFTGTWTILISVMMLGTPIFGTLMGVFGIVAGIGILIGLLEPAGWKPAGMIVALSYVVWSLWLIISGLILILA